MICCCSLVEKFRICLKRWARLYRYHFYVCTYIHMYVLMLVIIATKSLDKFELLQSGRPSTNQLIAHFLNRHVHNNNVRLASTWRRFAEGRPFVHPTIAWHSRRSNTSSHNKGAISLRDGKHETKQRAFMPRIPQSTTWNTQIRAFKGIPTIEWEWKKVHLSKEWKNQLFQWKSLNCLHFYNGFIIIIVDSIM